MSGDAITSDGEQKVPETERLSDQQAWAEVERYKADMVKSNVDSICRSADKAVEALDRYHSGTRKVLTVSSFSVIGIIFVGLAILTWKGLISGETLTFFSGTIVGYIINMLKL